MKKRILKLYEKNYRLRQLCKHVSPSSGLFVSPLLLSRVHFLLLSLISHRRPTPPWLPSHGPSLPPYPLLTDLSPSQTTIEIHLVDFFN
uniref:Uncharacterized protein n=1 Tax=Medicago truncatula TaxID=3880 RepID=A2Q334_MEDTR|nr:hypothetical protein MtrDRAFT_AC154391g20v2 [Medicago truncatula]